MPEPFTPEGEFTPDQGLSQTYSKTTEVLRQIDQSFPESTSEITKQRQKEVISRLPEDFIDKIEKHLNKGREEATRHKDQDFNEFSYVTGEVFEQLIEIEDQGFDLFPGIDKYPQNDRDKKAAKKLLDIMQNPTEFGLIRRSITNPDLVTLSLEKGTFIIKDATEAKTHLDKRSFRQLGRNGFKAGFQEIIDEINNMESPERFGLEEFAAYGINIDVALDYTQKLVLPRDLGTEREDIIKAQSNKPIRKQLNDIEIETFVHMLHNSQNVVVGRSAFSKAEIRSITRWTIEQITLKQKEETQTT